MFSHTFKIQCHSFFNILNNFFVSVALAVATFERWTKCMVAAIRFTLENDRVMIDDFFIKIHNRAQNNNNFQ